MCENNFDDYIKLTEELYIINIISMFRTFLFFRLKIVYLNSIANISCALKN